MVGRADSIHCFFIRHLLTVWKCLLSIGKISISIKGSTFFYPRMCCASSLIVGRIVGYLCVFSLFCFLKMISY